MTAIVDSGVLYAVFDRRDEHHKEAVGFFRQNTEALVVPATVLVEADYVTAEKLGVQAEMALLGFVAGSMPIEQITLADLQRSNELIGQYRAADIRLADASIVAIAERLGIHRVATFDRRHFRMIRPRHCVAFELVP